MVNLTRGSSVYYRQSLISVTKARKASDYVASTSFWYNRSWYYCRIMICISRITSFHCYYFNSIQVWMVWRTECMNVFTSVCIYIYIYIYISVRICSWTTCFQLCCGDWRHYLFLTGSHINEVKQINKNEFLNIFFSSECRLGILGNTIFFFFFEANKCLENIRIQILVFDKNRKGRNMKSRLNEYNKISDAAIFTIIFHSWHYWIHF